MMRFLTVPAALLAVTSAAASPAESATEASGRVLSGITCPRATSCWAVGDQTASGVTRTLIEHWNGRKWSLTRSPSVAGSADTFLNGVSCSARLNCWAVGAATLGSTKQEPIAEHWNGRRWSLTLLPAPARLAADELFSVWCPAATRCWAVGEAGTRRVSTAVRPLAEHWTGSKWRVVAARAFAGYSNLAGVFCRRDTDCWAVGSGPGGSALAEHWNGRRWSATMPFTVGGGLAAVWCPGTDCFATGISGYPAALAARWNGRKWSLTAIPPLAAGTVSDLPGVSCATSISCFAVGFANNRTLIERWRGSKWVRVKSPNPAGAEGAFLNRVFCLSPRACWAVGASARRGATSPGSTLAEHWNGTRWSIVRTP
jgi:hypothetical protein